MKGNGSHIVDELAEGEGGILVQLKGVSKLEWLKQLNKNFQNLMAWYLWWLSIPEESSGEII